MPKISVLMTTYNGGKYVRKQLESLYRQTRKPDEVVICDDRSTDSTCEIIQRFIKENAVSNWKLYINKENLGWKNNFFQGASKVEGDIIFFSDQDDIWHADKIMRMSELFVSCQMEGLYCGHRIIDENDNLIAERKEKSIHKDFLERIDFTPGFYAIRTLGCCECVSRKVIDLYRKINMPECGHDSQCGQIALLLGALWYLNEEMIDYRMHASNSSGVSIKSSYGQSSLERRICDIENSAKWIKKIIKMRLVSSDLVNQLKLSYSCAGIRAKYLRGDDGVNVPDLLRNRFGYQNWTALIGDIAYRYRINEKLGSIRWELNKMIGV